MDYIGISQSIGRVIRLGGTQKTFGLVCVPVYDKVGISKIYQSLDIVDKIIPERLSNEKVNRYIEISFA